jgi:adenylate kinase
MLVALTGTPGTGKSTVAKLLPYKVLDLNCMVREGLNLGVDEDRGCLEADMDALALKIKELVGASPEVIVLEGHLSHHFASLAVVLRLSPKVLRLRLLARGYSERKIKENLEAEALDVILVEAVEQCHEVHEIDTIDLHPEEVARLVVGVIRGDLHMPPGRVDWFDEVDFDLG